MNRIPIVFAFDNNLVFPACICLSSLMMHAKEDTFYDIYILHSENEKLNSGELDKLSTYYSNCSITYRSVGNIFDSSFEIRGITTPAYYRLLIPELIPEYDKVIYSDVDVIFRDDLSAIYENIDFKNEYFAGVNSLSHLLKDTKDYYENTLNMSATGIIYSGNLIINSKKIREDNLTPQFSLLADKKYRFQDMDMINVVCKEHIKYLSPSFCLTNYINDFAVNNRKEILSIWTEEEINEALEKGIVHYNGQKPWKGFCVNFDIWWEYYRKSPYFNEQFYFDFFYKKLDELDSLSLWKRIKILIRYFVYGKK